MKMKTSAAAFAVVAALTAAAFAHSGATGVVKERMDAMKAMGKATEALTKIMRGQDEYDAEAVKAHAVTIRTHAGEALTRMFPEGSNDHPSETLPEVWTNWDRFADLAKRLEVLANGLEAAASNGLMADGHHGNMGSMMGSDSDSMMGDGMMGGMMEKEMPSAEMLAQMPVDGVFNMMAQTCSACHTEFRIDKE